MAPCNAAHSIAVEVDTSSIEQALDSLNDLDHSALKERWRTLQGGDPPKRLSRQLLLRALAHAIQERAFGGLSPAVRQSLQRLAGELQSTGRISSIGRQSKFKSGTRLIREMASTSKLREREGGCSSALTSHVG